MGDVVTWPHPTRLDVPVERIIQGAVDANLESIVVAGYTAGGEEYFAASIADGGTVLWLIERMKMKLLAVPDEMTGDGA